MASTHRKIHRLVLMLKAHKTRLGQAYIKAMKSVESGEFHGTTVEDGSPMPLIHPSQFCHNLADILRRRMLTTAPGCNLPYKAADADSTAYKKPLT